MGEQHSKWVAFASSQSIADRVAGFIGGASSDMEVVSTNDWLIVEQLWWACRGGVFHLQHLEQHARETLRSLFLIGSYRSVVVVVENPPQEPFRNLPIVIKWVCALGDIADAWLVAQRQVARIDLANSIAVTHGLSPRIRSYLMSACVTPDPVRTVRELAAICGCSRRTLNGEWKTTLSDQLSPKSWLSNLLLLRAVELRDASRTWESIAFELGVSPSTLHRCSKRVHGIGIEKIAALGPSSVADAIVKQLGIPG